MRMLSSLEAHSTFTNESNGQLFIEMSLIATTRTDADANLCTFLGGLGGMLRVRGSLADLSSNLNFRLSLSDKKNLSLEERCT